MPSETPNLIFRYVMEHPESEIRDISNGIGINKQLVNYHMDTLIKTGLLVRKSVHRMSLYSCSMSDEETKAILQRADNIIIELHSKIKSNGAHNAKEVAKQILSAYVDVAIQGSEE